uniref:Uncharacterized protein n=1 Tax=Arundo donax TaxID=35708 RepID=A0A0A9H8A3_ARUDO
MFWSSSLLHKYVQDAIRNYETNQSIRLLN